MFELSNRCLLLVSIAFPNVSIGEKVEHCSSVGTYMVEHAVETTEFTDELLFSPFMFSSMLFILLMIVHAVAQDTMSWDVDRLKNLN